MISFNDFVHKYNLKNKTTSNIKIQRILSSIGLDNVGIYLRDGPFSSDIGIEKKLYPSKGTHLVVYNDENFCDSWGDSPPRKLSKFIIKRKGYCLYIDYRIQGLTHKKDSYCASFCFYIIYLSKVLQIDFKSALVNLFNQTISRK